MAQISWPEIKLDTFEGPFDLLLELAAAEKIDISLVSLATITSAYLEYIEVETLSTAVQADFLVIASTLLLLKIRHLLPQLLPPEELAEVSALTDRLRIYQLYREQALTIQERWNIQPLLPGPERLAVPTPVPFPTIQPTELAELLTKVIAKQATRKPPERYLRPQGRTLPEALAFFRDRLSQLHEMVFQLEMAQESAETVAVSFLAILELARAAEATLQQSAPGAPLTISR